MLPQSENYGVQHWVSSTVLLVTLNGKKGVHFQAKFEMNRAVVEITARTRREEEITAKIQTKG